MTGIFLEILFTKCGYCTQYTKNFQSIIHGVVRRIPQVQLEQWVLTGGVPQNPTTLSGRKVPGFVLNHLKRNDRVPMFLYIEKSAWDMGTNNASYAGAVSEIEQNMVMVPNALTAGNFDGHELEAYLNKKISGNGTASIPVLHRPAPNNPPVVTNKKPLQPWQRMQPRSDSLR